MTKRRGKRVNPFNSTPRRSKPGGGSSQKRRIQQLQQTVLETQDEIAEMTVTATAGGGMVTAVVNGERKVDSLTIAPEVIDPDDIEMLQDLVIAAINEGMEQVEQATSEQMEALTAGLGIPPDLLG